MDASIARERAMADAVDASWNDSEPPSALECVERITLDHWRADEAEYLICDRDQDSAEILSLIKCMSRAEKKGDRRRYETHALNLARLIHANAVTTAVVLWSARR